MPDMVIEAPSADEKDLAAYARRLMVPLRPDQSRHMVAEGWTRPIVQATVEAVTDWLIDGQTRYAQRITEILGDPAEVRHDIEASLLIGCYRVSRAPVSVGRRWLVTLFGTSSDSMIDAVRNGVNSGLASLVRLFEPIGEPGPLAWAAGLTSAEARRQAEVEGLDTDGLQVLAGLNGYRLPTESEWQPIVDA